MIDKLILTGKIVGQSCRRRNYGWILGLIALLWMIQSPLQAQRKRPEYVEVPCKHYFKGKLYHTFHPDSGIKIVRRAHRQKDYNPYTGEKRKWKIEWTGDCTYELTFLKSNQKTKLRKGWIQRDTIVDCYNTHYNWNGVMNGIRTYGSIARELTKAEKEALALQKEQEKLDSIANAKQDSIWRSEGKDPAKERRRVEKERIAAEKAAIQKAKDDSLAALQAQNNPDEEDEEDEESPDLKTNGDDPDIEKPKGKEKPPKPEKEGTEGDDPKEKKAKKEKPPKEKKAKKEKKPKEKKEKAEKPPKEKKEKPPKEKKEKPPKEKKEKPEKEE